MNDAFLAEIEVHPDQHTLLRVRFGASASNDVLVKEAAEVISNLALPGGPLLLIDGPMSLPVAFVIAHAVGHRYGAVAVRDPKLSAFVVAITHDPHRPLGDLLSAI